MAEELGRGVLLEPGVMIPASPDLAAKEDPASRNEGLFQDADSCGDHSCHVKPGATVNTLVPEGKIIFPQIIPTNELLFYERFRAYQDYILADCKASEVKEFTVSFLEKVLKPSGWWAVWHTNVFEVLVEVTNVDFAALKAVVRLAEPCIYESKLNTFTLANVKELLDLKEFQLPLQELWVVSDDSPEFHEMALAIEHVRYVFGYQKNSNIQAKGTRQNGQKVTHVVSSTMKTGLLRSLFRDRFCEESCKEETEIQFHGDLLSAINACHEGDTVIICPGHYVIHGTCSIADSIELEGYGLPDDIVIEKSGKGDTFVECTGMDVKISSIKFIQHDSIEGILIIHHGKTTLENCVLQCETTGITVRTSAELFMKNSDVYGAKGAGIEIYPGSKCTLTDNGIHHCKEGILIKDFLDEHYDIPKISMINNIIHNNEGYGVVLVKPTIFCDLQENAQDETSDNTIQKNREVGSTEGLDLEEMFQCVTSKMELCATADFSEQAKGNCEIINELLATSMQKGRMKKRLSKLGIIQADDNIMLQEMFIEIMGNQFKWNGKGSFGTFLY
ncbi:hypothetical protein STEG23_026006 [Scotinomys teguina]